MKYKALLIFINIFLLLIILFVTINHSFIKNDLNIAVVSMTGKYQQIGQDMLNGIYLYLDNLNKKGGINGRKVNLDVYDDKGDRNTAIKVAMEISKNNKALLVLGHYFSSTSLAAGNVYLKSRIPVITGSATAENITRKNEWFFSIAPNNSFQGEFIANYIRSTLGYKTCSVIYDENDFGKSLFNSFKSKAHILGLEIKNTWHFDKNSPIFSTQFNNLISQLRSAPNPGIIFVATHAIEGVRILSSLKYPGSTYQLIGPDSFSTNAFIKSLNRLPQEKASPGYYSDGIYTTTPFISDLTDDNNQQFITDYMATFNKKPSWVSACYYDATHIATKALQEIEGAEKIRSHRLTIKKFLVSRYNIETSEKGVTGPLFFDSDRNVKNPLRVCFYKNQELVPDFFQYNLINRPMEDRDAFDNILNNKLITSGNLVMNKTRIVFAGLHINKISNFDIHSGTCDMDFFLWFRFKGKFDENQITFLNSIKPVQLNKSIAEFTEDGMVTRVYHIQEQFSSILDFQRFPFETHNLYIKFRHNNQTADKLLYIPDNKNDSHLKTLLKIKDKKTVIETNGWTVYDTFNYNGIISYESSLGIPVQYHLKRPIVYSTATAAVQIKRKNISFVVKVMAPAVCLLLVFLSVNLLTIRFQFHYFFSLLSIMIISSFFLVKTFLFIEAAYLLFIQYAYLSLLIASASGIIFSVIVLLLKKNGHHITVLSKLFKILTFIIMIGFLSYGYLSYKPFKFENIIHIYKKPQTMVDSSSVK
jgi:branched-chain amino acid transport system substrate-binding protein